MKDNINPNHYKTRKHECIEFTRLLNFNLGNAFKYIWRFEHKNGKEDLEKALWYLRDQIVNRPVMPIITLPGYDLLADKVECCGFEYAHLNALDGVLYAAFAKNYESLRVAVNRVEKLIEKKYGKENEK
nr:MAG TPA: nucelotide kinase [Caudoviricetes sp.]